MALTVRTHPAKIQVAQAPRATAQVWEAYISRLCEFPT